MDSRLTKCDWLDHGLGTLAGEGTAALKIGPMAAKLGVSRGSFYWHFKDVGDFRTHLLERWIEQATEQVIRGIESGTPPRRLKALLRRAFANDRIAAQLPLETAMRNWARADPEVAAKVAAVDERRVDYIASLLAAKGVGSVDARDRAIVLCWAYFGRSAMVEESHAALPQSAIDALVTLFETSQISTSTSPETR